MKTVSLIAFFLLLNISPLESRAMDNMKLHGNGQAYYLKFIKVYDAELYTERAVTEEEILAGTVSKCLLLTYEVSLKQKDFIKAANTVLQRQFSEQELARVQGEINMLHDGYRDVKEGDQYSLCYDRSGQSTTLALNGNELVSIQSEPFSKLYFSIWLGRDKPLDNGLRDDLLARN